jgi:hypothetical protein
MDSWTEHLLILGLGVGSGLGLPTGMALGALLYAWHLERKNNIKLRLPAKWPLVPRAMLTSGEQEVLVWLQKIFPDHLVTIKTPVLRFTTLKDKEKSHASAKQKAQAKLETERLQERLGAVYTTFTVCTAAGKVVGCVDVPGKTPQTKAGRELKETLLSDCGIAYIVVIPSALPAASTMRAAFLNEALPAPSNHDISLLEGVDTLFRDDLKSFNVQPVKEKPAPKKVVVKGF